MRPKGSADRLEYRRQWAAQLLDEGRGVNEVARLVRASPSSVSRWKAMKAHAGEEGLKAKPHPGRGCRLSGPDKVWTRPDRVSVQAAVTLPPRRQRLGVYFRLYEQNIHTQDGVSFVGYMMSMIRRKIVLILDRWSVHRAAVAILQKRYADRLTIEWLPAYAPELNPVEQVWNHTKYGDLANFRPEHIDPLADAVTMSMTAQHHDTPLIRGFFKYAQRTL